MQQKQALCELVPSAAPRGDFTYLNDEVSSTKEASVQDKTLDLTNKRREVEETVNTICQALCLVSWGSRGSMSLLILRFRECL